MKDDELEKLAGDYVSGNMSQLEMVDFERMLENNVKAKHKVSELSLAWDALSVPANQAIVNEMDKGFYAFLNEEMNRQQKVKVRQVRSLVYWLSSAAAVIIFMLAFYLGKYSIHPEVVVRYKMVQVIKPGPVQTKIIKRYVVRNVSNKKVNKISLTSPLIAQLRSAYSSKRMSAVLLMGEHGLNENDLKALDSLLKHDPDQNVQLAILYILEPRANSIEVQHLLVDALPFVQGMVQSSVVDILLDKKSKEAVPEMLALLRDANTDYHTQGQIMLSIEGYLK